MALVSTLIGPIKQKLRKCPEATIRQAYVRAARTLLGRSRWYLSPLTAPLVAGTAQYSLGTDPQLEILDVPIGSLTQPNNAGVIPIIPTPAWNFNPNADQGTPQYFAYVPEGSVSFYPVPDQAYTVTLSLVLQCRESATEVDDYLLIKWRRAFENGALTDLYLIPGEPWFSAELAMSHKREFERDINNAQIDRERGYVWGSQRAQARRFVVQGG